MTKVWLDFWRQSPKLGFVYVVIFPLIYTTDFSLGIHIISLDHNFHICQYKKLLEYKKTDYILKVKKSSLPSSSFLFPHQAPQTQLLLLSCVCRYISRVLSKLLCVIICKFLLQKVLEFISLAPLCTYSDFRE